MDNLIEVVEEISPVEIVKEPWFRQRVECDLCEKTFKTQYTLNSHVREIHTYKGDAQACPICKKKLKNSRSLWCHLRNIHVNRENVDVQSAKILIQDDRNKVTTEVESDDDGDEGDDGEDECGNLLTPPPSPTNAPIELV